MRLSMPTARLHYADPMHRNLSLLHIWQTSAHLDSPVPVQEGCVCVCVCVQSQQKLPKAKISQRHPFFGYFFWVIFWYCSKGDIILQSPSNTMLLWPNQQLF